MNFFCIQDCLNTKIVGIYPQVQEAIYNCSVWEEPKFVDRVNFIKTDFEPIVANAIIGKKAKLTDLISSGIMGFSLKLLISGKLKNIIKRNQSSGTQFYQSPVVNKDEYINDYWILNPYQIDMQNIDFEKSEVFLMENTFNKVEKLFIDSLDNFNKQKADIAQRGYPFSILIERLAINNDVTQDFFTLLNVEGGVKYVISENLKVEIEQEGCTGLEFMPIEFLLNEWFGSGGKRERVYGKV